MSGLLTYSCHYRCPYGNRFTTQVRATPDTIGEVLRARNIGEMVDDCMALRRPPHCRALHQLLEREGLTLKTLHHAAFIGWQAREKGAAGADDILGDCGLVHEMIHGLDPDNGSFAIGREFSDLVELARRIEGAIPGSVVHTAGEAGA